MTLPGLGPEYGVPGWLRDRIQKCRSCDRPIVWALTRTDGPSTMPVDPVPVPNGNVHLWLDGGTLRAFVGRDDAPTWVSHFATCPDAKKWRKRR